MDAWSTSQGEMKVLLFAFTLVLVTGGFAAFFSSFQAAPEEWVVAWKIRGIGASMWACAAGAVAAWWALEKFGD